MRRALFEAGAHEPGIRVLRRVLGGDAFLGMMDVDGVGLAMPAALSGKGPDAVGRDCKPQGARAAMVACGDGEKGEREEDWGGACWVPDLGHEAFQDVDLLG